MKIHHHHHHALALVSAVIVLGCILIIGGIAVKILLNLCKRINPPVKQPGDPSTNAPTTSLFPGVTTEGVWQAPQLRFAPLAAPVGQTAANPFGNAHLEVERSTNLVDWETIAVISEPGEKSIMEYDTNPPPDRAFYRGKFVYP